MYLDSTVPLTQKNPRKITETMPKKSSVTKKQTKPLKGINDIRKMFRNVAKANNDEDAIFSCKLEEFLNKFGVDTSTTQSIREYLKSENIPSHLLDLIVELELDKSQSKKDANSNNLEINVGKMDTTLPAAVLKDISFPEISCFKGFSSVSWDCLKTSTNYNDCTVIDAFTELEEFCPCPDIIESEFNHDAYDCATQNSISPNICDDNNKTIAYNDNCITTNFDLIDMDAIFGDSSESQSKDKLKSEDNCLKDDSNIGNETKNICAQNETKKGLDFFGLDDIDTIFGNSESNEVDSKDKTNENLILNCSIEKDKDCSKTSENNGTKSGLEFFGLDNIEDLYFGDSSDESRNNLDMNITEISISDNDNNSNQSIENVLSPIISSQIPKKNIFNKTAATVKSFEKSFKESSQKADDGSTFFSISQAISFISSDNKPTDGSLKRVIESDQTTFSNNTENMHHEESNGSDGSVILCTQTSKKESNRRKISPKQFKPNVIIPASSDESDATDEVECQKINTEKVDSNQNVNKINSDVFKTNVPTLEKRELSSDDEISSFFHKFPKIENVSLKNTSLVRKNMNAPNISKLKNLTLSTMKENVRPDDENVSCFNISSDHDLSTYFEMDKGLGISKKQTLNLSKFECSTNRSFNHLNGDKNDNCDSDDDFVEKSQRNFKNKNDKSLEENKKKRVKKVSCLLIECV